MGCTLDRRPRKSPAPLPKRHPGPLPRRARRVRSPGPPPLGRLGELLATTEGMDTIGPSHRPYRACVFPESAAPGCGTLGALPPAHKSVLRNKPPARRVAEPWARYFERLPVPLFRSVSDATLGCSYAGGGLLPYLLLFRVLYRARDKARSQLGCAGTCIPRRIFNSCIRRAPPRAPNGAPRASAPTLVVP